MDWGGRRLTRLSARPSACDDAAAGGAAVLVANALLTH
jgi:hypothetical protein